MFNRDETVDEQHDNPKTAEHGADINVALIAWLGLISTLVLVVIVVGVQACFYHAYEAELQRKVVNQPYAELEEQRKGQIEKLDHYGHPDEKDKRVVRIPIDLAIKQYVKANAARGQ